MTPPMPWRMFGRGEEGFLSAPFRAISAFWAAVAVDKHLATNYNRHVGNFRLFVVPKNSQAALSKPTSLGGNPNGNQDDR
jgi:hypothetical protein